MGKAIDIPIGSRFGKLVVLSRHGIDRYKNTTWDCKCDCGKDAVVIGSLMRAKKQKAVDVLIWTAYLAIK